MAFRKKSGFLLVEAMIVIIIAGTIAAIFSSMSYYTYIQANLLKRQNTTMILSVVRSRLMVMAQNPEQGLYFVFPLEDANNTLPINVGMTHDAWGRAIKYYPIDLNVVPNITSISPNENILARLLSAGEDGIFTTEATHKTAQGDDVMLEIGVGETNHYKLYGGSEITTETRGYNSAHVSETEPTTPINGMLWYDTKVLDGGMKMYDANSSNWISLKS